MILTAAMTPAERVELGRHIGVLAEAGFAGTEAAGALGVSPREFRDIERHLGVSFAEDARRVRRAVAEWERGRKLGAAHAAREGR